MVANFTLSDDQKKKFFDAAKRTEADESGDALERIMGKLDLTKKPEPDTTPAKK